MENNEVVQPEGIVLSSLDIFEPIAVKEFRAGLVGDLQRLTSIVGSSRAPNPASIGTKKKLNLFKPVSKDDKLAWKAVSPPVHRSFFGMPIDSSPSECATKNPFLMGMYHCSGISPPHMMKGHHWKSHSHISDSGFGPSLVMDWSKRWYDPNLTRQGAFRASEDYIKKGTKRYKSLR